VMTSSGVLVSIFFMISWAICMDLSSPNPG
jgi:hypothetical protein